MAEHILGNAVGLIASTTEPSKKYIWWFKILNASYPNEGVLMKYDASVTAWVPANESFWLGAVTSYALNTPPVSPALGASYIIGASPTGIWIGKNGQHAVWMGNSYLYTIPRAGSRVGLRSSSADTYFYNGTVWSVISSGGSTYTGTNGINVTGTVIKWGDPLTEDTELDIDGNVLIFKDGASTIADFTSIERTFFSGSGEEVIDLNAGFLSSPVGGSTVIDLVQGFIYDETGGTPSVQAFERILLDSDNADSWNWEQRKGYKEDGITVAFDYEAGQVYNYEGLMMSWQQEESSVQIYEKTGVDIIAQYDTADAVFYLYSITKPFIGPRMTSTQRDAIPSPTAGSELYNSTTKRKEFNDGIAWKAAPLKYYAGGLTLVAATPLTITHNLNLTDKDAFTIRVADSTGATIEVDVLSIDADSLSLTSTLGLTNVKVCIIG